MPRANETFWARCCWPQTLRSYHRTARRRCGGPSLGVTKVLEDGSFLSTIYRRDKKSERALEAIEVRIIEYALPDMPESEPRYRLMTTLLDPCVAPSQELAALYHARWHVESVFDEMKTHPYLRYNIANAILQFRTQHGNFAKVDDLKKIILVSDEIYTKLIPYIRVQ